MKIDLNTRLIIFNIWLAVFVIGGGTHVWIIGGLFAIIEFVRMIMQDLREQRGRAQHVTPEQLDRCDG